MVEEPVKKTYFTLIVFVGLWLGKLLTQSPETECKSTIESAPIQEYDDGVQAIRNGDTQKWIPNVLRYVVYLLLIKGSQEAFRILYRYHINQKRINPVRIFKESKQYAILCAGAIALLIYLKETIFKEDFLLLFVAYLIIQYPEMEGSKQPMINYGTGMACSFFEGYLVHVIPSDGARFVGFEENIRALQYREKIVFPVPRLFIIITKSLYCPPDLSHCNKLNKPELPHLEAIKSMADVIKDVAGVKQRTYRNSAYKIHRPSGPPVHLAAEFATPLHTLHKVLKNRDIYEQLCDVNVEEIVEDFCTQLQRTIERSHDCRDKCYLVHYDDTDPSQNLADVLLAKIAEIEPDFEEVIARGNADR